jgi:hypothetical protein
MSESIKKNQEVIEPEPETTKAKPYTFRRLAAEDIFPMFTIINKIGMKEFKTFFGGDNLARLAATFKGDKTAEAIIEEVGLSVFIELVSIILGNLPKCENDIFNMLANTSDLTVEQVKKLDMADFAEMIMDFVKKDEFADFIRVVSKLFK